jgi:flavin reductase (DIM6/NTAB) family NADH-FMN oxidoreductase RutF
MKFDMRELDLGSRYKIVNSTITPRPIAWIVTRGENGVINAAPYSFFNACGVEPPMVMLGLLRDMKTGLYKDTATNIAANGEFTVNLVSEADVETMNLSSVDAPRNVSEVDYAGIETTPSDAIAPPRIATAPVSFECRKIELLDIGRLQSVLIGEILVAHIRDEFITNAEKYYLDTPAMKLVGRTHGAGWYARTSDQFSVERPRFDPEWAAKVKAKE